MTERIQIGLIGHQISSSLSPAMHNAALSYSGLTGEYRLFDIAPADLKDQLPKLIDEGLTGFNVTIPHKLAVKELCATLTDAGARAGAVNTVIVKADGSLTGHNTDIEGFERALADFYPASSRVRSACILGAGGAARAALLVLLQLGFEKIFIVARDKTKGEDMQAGILDSTIGSALISAMDCDELATASGINPNLVVNSLPLGTTIKTIPKWLQQFLERLSSGAHIYDMVYSRNNQNTLLVEAAGKLPLQASDGTEMLVQQAAASFRFWTDCDVPAAIMREALLQARCLETKS